MPNGWGVFRWPDNSVFQGFWKDGRRHGNSGTLIVSDGFRYEGAWVDNAMEGRGVATVSRLLRHDVFLFVGSVMLQFVSCGLVQ